MRTAHNFFCSIISRIWGCLHVYVPLKITIWRQKFTKGRIWYWQHFWLKWTKCCVLIALSVPIKPKSSLLQSKLHSLSVTAIKIPLTELKLNHFPFLAIWKFSLQKVKHLLNPKCINGLQETIVVLLCNTYRLMKLVSVRCRQDSKWGQNQKVRYLSLTKRT